MIDGQQFYLVEIDGLFQRLHETEAELAVFFADGGAVYFDVFRGTRNVALAGADPVADHAGAEHVANELVAFSIPNEKGGAGAATAIDFHVFLFAVGGDFDFVLQNPSRPEHADDVGLGGLSETDGQEWGVLAEIAVRSVDLEFLAIASREDFDFGPNGALVVGKPFQIEAQPVVLVAAFISQQDSRTVILRDEKVGGAIAVVVASDDGARILELNLVEADVGRDVLETVRAEIAEQAHFALAVFRLADSDEIDPAVVVVVDGGHAETANPIRRGQRNLLELLFVVVSPKSDARIGIFFRLSPMSKC